MNAKVTSFNATDKVPLYKNVPLETPYLLTMEPSGLCNLKCNFCLLSLPKDEVKAKGHNQVLMSDEVFDRIINDLGRFPDPFKLVVFARLGEPLMNKKVPTMVERLKSKNLCKKVLIISNGIPLTHNMSRDLVDAGLDTIKLSINGLSPDDYLKNCGVKVDFDKLVSETAYLFKIKKNTKIQLKIMDKLLGDDIEKGKSRFYKIFGDITDEISVEHLFPMFGEELDINDIYFKSGPTPKSRYCNNINTKICPTPFYKMLVAADGMLHYCFSRGVYAGSLLEKSLFDVWHSSHRKELLKNLLMEKHEGITAVCASCGCAGDLVAKEDVLDPYAEELIAKIEDWR